MHLPEFHFGQDAVLLAMDTAGVDALTVALNHALTHGDGRLENHRQAHHFLARAGAAHLGLHDECIEWRLDPTKIIEMTDKLAAMKNTAGPAHHYVDISTPADTLILSVDEYSESTWPP